MEFVVKNYRHGAFDTRKAWASLGIFGFRKPSVMKIAGIVALLIAVTATAAIVLRNNVFTGNETESTGSHSVSDEQVIATVAPVDFDNTPLTEVIEKVNAVYGVHITNLPENAGEYRLTLHYEGSADNLVATINELLGIELEIEE